MKPRRMLTLARSSWNRNLWRRRVPGGNKKLITTSILLVKKVSPMPVIIGTFLLVLFKFSPPLFKLRNYCSCPESDCVMTVISFDLFISVLKEAEANKLKLTPQFLELKFIEAIADNTKIFFGDKARSVFLFMIYITYALLVYNLTH